MVEELSYYSDKDQLNEDMKIQTFSDGGVTVTLPLVKSRDRLLTTIIGIMIGMLSLLLIPCLLGSKSFHIMLSELVARFDNVLPMLIKSVVQSPVSMIIIFTPISFFVVRCATLRIRMKPTVVGISPSTVYLDMPSWFARRRIEVPRSRLQRIEVGQFYRDISRHFLKITICGRRAVRLLYGEPLEKIQVLSKVLNNAAIATATESNPMR